MDNSHGKLYAAYCWTYTSLSIPGGNKVDTKDRLILFCDSLCIVSSLIALADSTVVHYEELIRHKFPHFLN